MLMIFDTNYVNTLTEHPSRLLPPNPTTLLIKSDQAFFSVSEHGYYLEEKIE